MALDLVSRMTDGSLVARPDVPTFNNFAPRWIEEYARANRQKPRGVESKESILRVHLLPRFGSMRLDDLVDSDVQALKADLAERSAKTVNNVLTVLGKMLRIAVRWRVLQQMPVQIELLPVQLPEVAFYEFDEYARMVDVCTTMLSAEVSALVLLGGDAGLRMGEIIGLEWEDVDWRRGQLCIQRSESKGHITSPKGGRTRIVPLTDKLLSVLCAITQGPRVGRVLCDGDKPVTEVTARRWMREAQRAACLRVGGNLHILRHTFCSHLAMRGAPPLAIQQLAGHTSLRTTMRYMHLSPTEAKRAIGLLDENRSHGFSAATRVTALSPTGFEPVGDQRIAKPVKPRKPRFNPRQQPTRRSEDSLDVLMELLVEANAQVSSALERYPQHPPESSRRKKSSSK
jgi:integrase